MTFPTPIWVLKGEPLRGAVLDRGAAERKKANIRTDLG